MIKVGDYVFASEYSDGSPNDPWEVGYVKEIKEGGYVKVNSDRGYKHSKKITSIMGKLIVENFPEFEEHRCSASHSWKWIRSEVRRIKQQEAEVLRDFANKIEENSVQLDGDIADAINDCFWDMG